MLTSTICSLSWAVSFGVVTTTGPVWMSIVGGNGGEPSLVELWLQPRPKCEELKQSAGKFEKQKSYNFSLIEKFHSTHFEKHGPGAAAPSWGVCFQLLSMYFLKESSFMFPKSAQIRLFKETWFNKGRKIPLEWCRLMLQVWRELWRTWRRFTRSWAQSWRRRAIWLQNRG